jgi:hypothetical protein
MRTRGGGMWHICSNITWPRINPMIIAGPTTKSIRVVAYYCNITYIGGGYDEEVSWATQALCYIPNGIICENSTNWSSVAD